MNIEAKSADIERVISSMGLKISTFLHQIQLIWCKLLDTAIFYTVGCQYHFLL